MTEEELIVKIDLTNKSLEIIKVKQKELNLELLDQETLFVESKLHLDNLKEQLTKLRQRTVHYEISERDKDIERFRLVLPALLEKIVG